MIGNRPHIDDYVSVGTERLVSLDAREVTLLRSHRLAMVRRGGEKKLVCDAFCFSDAEDGSTPWSPADLARRFRRACQHVHHLAGDRELHALVLSGIPPAAALKIGTINGARALNVAKDDHWMKHTFATRGSDGSIRLDYKDVTLGRYEPVERKY